MNYDPFTELIERLEVIKTKMRDEASRLRVVSLQFEIDKRAAYAEGFRAGAEAGIESAREAMARLSCEVCMKGNRPVMGEYARFHKTNYGNVPCSADIVWELDIDLPEMQLREKS